MAGLVALTGLQNGGPKAASNVAILKSFTRLLLIVNVLGHGVKDFQFG